MDALNVEADLLVVFLEGLAAGLLCVDVPLEGSKALVVGLKDPSEGFKLLLRHQFLQFGDLIDQDLVV